MALFQPYESFLINYPLGSFGSIYVSEDNVVKVFEPILEYEFLHIEKFLREVIYYSSLKHELIIGMVAFSFSSDKKCLYLAMPKGISIVDAVRKGFTSIEEVSNDLLSVLLFLEENNLVHNDIKHLNLVYHEGKTKLIDFGLSAPSYPCEQGNYFNQPLYTFSFRDYYRKENLDKN